MRLTKAQRRIICETWDAIESESEAQGEDISTERLFALTCEVAGNRLGLALDDGDVADALESFHGTGRAGET